MYCNMEHYLSPPDVVFSEMYHKDHLIVSTHILIQRLWQNTCTLYVRL